MCGICTWMTRNVPYIGNLVKTHYLIGNPQIGIPMRKMQCRTVLMSGGPFDNVDGMVVSATELQNANARFDRYRDRVEERVSEAFNNPGTFEKVKLYPRNWKKTDTVYWVVCFTGWIAPHVKSGYMFNTSELKEIVERTERIKKTVKRPNWFDRLLIKIYGLEE